MARRKSENNAKLTFTNLTEGDAFLTYLPRETWWPVNWTERQDCIDSGGDLAAENLWPDRNQP